MFDVDEIRDNLASTGWCRLRCELECSLEATTASLASQIGIPRGMRKHDQSIETLRIIDAVSAFPASLSRAHGDGAFPFHTDTAHWSTPCRFVLLACKNSGIGSRATRLIDSKQLELTEAEYSQLKTAPFQVRNGRKSFFTSIMSGDCYGIRFDMGCMRAATSEGNQLVSLLCDRFERSEALDIHWRINDILLIDNYRLLHARSGSTIPDPVREILRILIL